MIYHILTRRQPYHELGVAYFDQLERQRVEQRLVHRLERLGYTVALQPRTETPNSAWFWLIGSSCPLQSAQPFGAKLNDMILISDRNGSAMVPPDLVEVTTTGG
ncbi:MAG: hypothetical protein AVDCRST_MAG93-5142 [uncultured Chloroflexia bacterium]|uniref:Uncharacterized protein n=1 Tax=uncultured Chloroflexia bacterium TaxID=1672391 RepID=A0A6J4KMJ1_9CHLR|nr:MAG: hypothetical protein AVDCRST_MAG93-5142 [uncultured Chloroflexia bacterium]